MVGRAKLLLESKPIPTRGGLKQTLCTPEPRDPTETEPDLCLSVSCRDLGQQWPAAERHKVVVITQCNSLNIENALEMLLKT